eukprot:c2158_g1_i1.p1 GENE.c2158_g1_i1~~c2158_g1_i1.p1  ORF type:complete len:362 (-),score=55.98 c2158_g1_i1:15-1100(-)
MGFDRDLVIDPPEHLSELICGICSDVIQNAVMTDCEHYFCAECVKPYVESQHNCPQCRRPCQISDLKPLSRGLRNILNAIRIRCSNQGCSTSTTLEFISQHLQSDCPFSIVLCPCEGCPFSQTPSIRRGELAQHLGLCDYRPSSCALGCGQVVPFIHLESHTNSCEFRPTSCPNECGYVGKAGDIAKHVQQECSRTIVHCQGINCDFQCCRSELEEHMVNSWKIHQEAAANQVAAMAVQLADAHRLLSQQNQKIFELSNELARLRGSFSAPPPPPVLPAVPTLPPIPPGAFGLPATTCSTFPFPTFPSPSPPVSTEGNELRKLSQLTTMGFLDITTNRRLLKQYNGNLNQVVEVLRRQHVP